MKITFSPDVKKDFRKIKTKDKKLYAKIEKQLVFFVNKPKHPSLRIHKLTGKLNKSWSLSVERNIRIVYVDINRNEIYIIAIGTHEQVYHS